MKDLINAHMKTVNSASRKEPILINTSRYMEELKDSPVLIALGCFIPTLT